MYYACMLATSRAYFIHIPIFEAASTGLDVKDVLDFVIHIGIANRVTPPTGPIPHLVHNQVPSLFRPPRPQIPSSHLGGMCTISADCVTLAHRFVL